MPTVILDRHTERWATGEGHAEDGRYHATYRFKFPGPVAYQFRVLSRYEADFPFQDGTSNTVDVHEH